VFFFVVAIAEGQLRGIVQLWLGRALAVIGAAAAAASIVVYHLSAPEGARLAGLGQLDNPVVAGLIYGAVLILVLEMLISDRSWFWRSVAVPGVVITAAAIVMSGSRNAWVSAGIGVLILVFANVISDRLRFLGVISVLAVILGALLIGVWNNDAGHELLLPRGDSFRLDIWSKILHELARDHLIVGRGILTPDQVEAGGYLFDHPHNMYLAVLFQGGLIGLALFCSVFCWCLVILYEGYEHRSAKLGLALLGMALISYLVDGHELVDKVGETWFLFWLPVGIGLGLTWTRVFGNEYGALVTRYGVLESPE